MNQYSFPYCSGQSKLNVFETDSYTLENGVVVVGSQWSEQRARGIQSKAET